MSAIDRIKNRLNRIFGKQLPFDSGGADNPILPSLLYSAGMELDAAILNTMLLESNMYLHTAAGEMLDWWCAEFFGIFRAGGENDTDYRSRVLNTISLATQNNTAIEIAIIANEPKTTDVLVTDAPAETLQVFYNGSFLHDASHYHVGGLTSQQKFDIEHYVANAGQALTSAEEAALVAFVKSLKSAGTYIRKIDYYHGTRAARTLIKTVDNP